MQKLVYSHASFELTIRTMERYNEGILLLLLCQDKTIRISRFKKLFSSNEYFRKNTGLRQHYLRIPRVKARLYLCNIFPFTNRHDDGR